MFMGSEKAQKKLLQAPRRDPSPPDFCQNRLENFLLKMLATLHDLQRQQCTLFPDCAGKRGSAAQNS
jgi:hypothetical protein